MRAGDEAGQSYQLGWDDGWSEGYACKLTDATTPFCPASLEAPEIVERVADYIARKYAAYFDRPSALGLARGMLRIAREGDNTPDLDRRPA